jgi:flagellar biosynthesis GTPase FlhF
MGDSSDIDALIKDMNNSNLSQEEKSMVNSILNELNGPAVGGQDGSPGGPKVTSQQQKPQITDEEKEMLMKQQMQEQRIAQQRMQQQMMQEQQQQQQQQQHQQHQQQQHQQQANVSTIDQIRNILFEYKDVAIVLLLSILFNLEIVSSNLTLKNVSFMYDMEKGKETIFSTVFKGLIIAVIFLILKIFIK